MLTKILLTVTEAYKTSSGVENCVIVLKVNCENCQTQNCSFFSPPFITDSFLINQELIAGLMLDFPRLMSCAEGNVK